jgi:alkaline phosphatase D
MRKNPHIKFANGTQRGYSTVELTLERCVNRIRVVDSATRRDALVRTLATYVLENGRRGAERA